ncbi:Long-chain-fatty-acid--CoA ligase [Corallococcus coralloides DSM 2259]|uniref:Long-chain-fatty-acid--CoA ligase n=1 Tax=Corallococcus coralloides (strain ATCC 25202 / DSM 2259 / NBRC 100086 / M2) TaxID=1144275 RepID=H8MFD7_CORCM|nr:non-ribosomal peptide synthetase [Corallococcus coralloides]AFE10581.1 Long-chain-fatty-acid--CoA ligase [Corallococcus coralloides DSM 2259]
MTDTVDAPVSSRALAPRNIADAFEAQAALHPHAVAVRCDGQQLTYAELDARANRLAGWLKARGVGRARPQVGVCLPRSVDLIVTLIGILKAGGAYVPLDPEYPSERLALMATDSRVRIIVTHAGLESRLPSGDWHTLRLDADAGQVAGVSDRPVACDIVEDDLAYVIFTSGSTGRPKGVCVPHRGVLRMVLDPGYAHLGPDEVLLQLSPVAFDASTFELWGALLNGGILAVFSPGASALDELGDFLRAERVTTAFLTTGLFNTMVDRGLPGTETLRQLLTGGEVMSLPHARRALELLPQVHLVNCYGPTENSAFTSCQTVRAPLGSGPVPIGHAISGTRMYVLDAQGGELPVGAVGELYTGGSGVAWGYWERPDLTAERFLPDPFSTEPGARMYRTGDLVRRLDDGAVDFVGRGDQQVKVRGFRIEPGEIEAALRLHASVQQAVVMVREDVPGDRRLVAYVTASEPLKAPVLRTHLKGLLPAHMLPSAIVVLDEMPLAASGKVERKSLPDPRDHAGAAEDFVAPETALEQTIARVWADVLRVGAVSATAHFFELGGQSLLATQAIGRLCDELQRPVTLRSLFAHPVLRDFAAALETAAPTAERAEAPIPPCADAAREQLSFAQQRLWFLDQWMPGSALYSLPFAFRLEGPLEPALLEQALQAVVDRHEALRTTFPGEGTARQHVAANVSVTLERAVTGSGEETLACMQREAERPFDLSRGPLFRALLIREAEQRHVLVLNLHHIVSDGWSFGVLYQELSTAYRAQDLAPLPIQYPDYAAWQRQWLQGDVLQRELGFWQRQLADVPHVLELPTDRPRPAVQRFEGAIHRFTLPASLRRALEGLARREGATLFMALLTGFQVLLSRYSGQRDFVVGTPIANRTRKELEGLIGFFVNTLPIRARFEGRPSFVQLLGQVRDDALGAYAHQHLPFEKLVDALQVERDPSRTPLLQVLFALQNAPASQLQLPDVTVTPLTLDTRTSKFDLFLALEESSDGLVGTLEYATALFDAATIVRMADHFHRLLEGALHQPDAAIEVLPWLSEAERHQALVAWNDTARTYPREASLVRAFSAQVAARPDAIAVRHGSDVLTYAELDARANQVAWALKARGVGRDAPRVGVCLPRSIDLVVSLVAILKAGGAYVPLDPDYPADRLAFMATDARLVAVVTASALADHVPAGPWTVLRLDALPNGLERHAPPDACTGDDLAHIIYTSGSTGRPKGVCIPHRGVARLVLNPDFIQLRPEDRIAQTSTVAFDASTFELWSALLNGATLVLLSKEEVIEPTVLARRVREEGITVLFLTTALLNHVARTDPSLLKGLRWLLFGGEAADPACIRAILAHSTPEHLVNAYGPTENSAYSTWFSPKHVELNAVAVPIGRPVSNSTAYVFDSHLHPVAPGIVGELFVGGDGLAWGYWERPELTATAFIPHPFTSIPGARLYRTGDLVRQRHDGAFDFVGRRDHQVKVRGFRIEPGEIEAVLRQHPAVREALVLVREDSPGDKRLVAYVTFREVVTAQDLRAHAQGSLPSHMVPSAFVLLDALPMTPNGKVDRRALPVPEGEVPTLSGARPLTALEQTLSAIWCTVLNLPHIPVDANFFDLGGHSLLATQIVSRASQVLGIPIPVRTLFEFPTIEGMARALEGRMQDASGPVPALQPWHGEGPPPLSFAQERLWFLNQLHSDRSAYNMPMVLRLEGALDVDTLERALQALVDRHESLRTVFPGEGVPVQRILPQLPVSLRRVEASSRDEAEALLRDDAETPFDLAEGPLFRTLLVREDAEHHVLLLNLHHIVSDGWSMGVLYRELSAEYSARVQGESLQLPSMSVQYADYAAWQRQWLQGEVLQRQLDFWKQQLADAPHVLELPTDRPRPAVQQFNGTSFRFTLPSALRQALEALGRQEGATLFMTLLTGFQLLLSRYSGQRDFLVGTPIANRTREEVEGLIGFFVNTLPLRAHLRDGASFREVLRQVRDRALGAYAHQELPFEKLVEELHVERSLSHGPLVQVMFALQNAPGTLPRLPGIQVQAVELPLQTSKFDLSLMLEETRDGLSGVLEYATALFDADTIERMADHLHRLLEGVLRQPDAALDALPWLSEAERHQVLVAWNDTARPYPREASLVQAFNAQVAAHPDAFAVRHGSDVLTYAELDARANQVAWALKAQGVGRDAPRVGVCLPRSIDLVVSLVAILKAGGAYVPLDPDYPADRLSFMATDAMLVAIVTGEEVADHVPEGPWTVLRLDALPAALERHAPPDACTGDDLAHIIYTSGSTGRPKGVCIPHRGVARLVLNPDFIQLRPEDRIAQTSTVAFDASTFELWSALLNGATLVLLSKEEVIEPSVLARRVREEGITVLFLTTALLNHVARTDPSLLKGLRWLLFGGEAADPDCIRAILAHSTPKHLVNAYGPTENSAYSTWFSPTHVEPDAVTVPIGRPVSNSTAYVLDSHLHPVAPGIVGDLFVGGDGLAWGYWERPDLTATAFIPHPFASTPGARLYRTGDLVRQRHDGAFDFVGRRDHQVKVRGFRIEPGEIEAVLRQHPAVREALVLVREDSPGDKRLVAYVTFRDTVMTSDLRSHVQGSLPSHMVPSAFVLLDALPMTPNGKVDRRALPVPEGEAAPTAGTRPLTALEQTLSAIWCAVLNLAHIPVDANFFDLGGHSLLATQIVSRASQVLGIPIPVRTLFEFPTIEGMARALEGRMQDSSGPVPALQPLHREGPLSLSFAQERLWFLNQLHSDRSAYNMPMVLRLEGALDVDAMERALQALVDRHESLRTVFPGEGVPVQRILPQLPVSLRRVEASSRDEAEALLRDDAETPFDLAEGPLFRTLLVREDAEHHVLLLNLHHIVSDGWSMGVLYRELSAEYDARHAGRSSNLAALPVQYADFAARQRQWLQGDVLQRQLDFWKQQLADVPHVLALPTDHPRPAVQQFAGSTHAFTLPRTVLDALEGLGRQEGATLFMTLMAGFQLLLSRYSGQRDFIVGTPIANRTREEVEGLIGFFVNTLPLRAHLRDGASFREVLRQVRDRALGAYAHQELPFEKLVEELHVERALSHGPLVQAMFTLQNAPGAPPQLPGLQVQVLELQTPTAKFDLTLDLTETPEGLRGTFEYATSLFEPRTLERMADHFRRILEGALRQPDVAIHGLPWLSEAERQQVLTAWNDTGRPYPRDASLVRTFEAQVATRPDAIAVRHGPQVLTYAELDARANQLAWTLKAQGVGPEAPRVGVCLPRSIDLIVSLVAILKAGGAYVPLDPDYPADRLALMISDAKVHRIITGTASSIRFSSDSVGCIRIDALEAPAHSGSPYDAARFHPLDPAYLIYTSGSTGRPKGVCVPHQAVMRLVMDPDYISFGPDDRVAQAATVSFDASTFEVWGALLNGATLVLFSKEEILDPLALARGLRDERITAMFLTTSLFNHVTRLEPTAFNSLSTLVVGGEALDPACVNRLLAHGGPRRLVNGYGPTENTTFSTWHLITEPVTGAVPIGRPLSNSTAYVLDAHLHPVAPGIVGELFVGGDGLAWGYWERPELTATAFIPHPFASTPGARLYRTGDLVRQRNDGAFDFVGRRDHQVKVRGFRIEPGEIEAVLRQHPAVREALVLVREDSPGDKRLVAYVTFRDAVTAQDLRAHVQGSLPSHMVPSAFVLLEALPLNANGKVDRRALPRPSDSTDTVEADVPPRTPLEQQIADIWAEVLGRKVISVTASFFDLGGHSLLAAQLVSRLSEHFSFKVPLQVLFQSPTVAALAQWIQAKLTPDAPVATQGPTLPEGIVQLQQGRSDLPPLWCMHPVGGTVFCYQDLVRALGPERTVYGFQAPGVNGECPPLASIEALASHHLGALLQWQPQGPYYFVGLSMGGTIVYEMAQRMRELGIPPALLVFLDTPGPGQMPTQFEDDAALLAAVFGADTPALAERLRSLPPHEQMKEVLRQAREGATVPESYSLRDLEIFLDVWKAHMRALFSYEPKPYGGSATYLKAQVHVPPHPLHPEQPWQGLVRHGLEVLPVPGNHQTMIEPPNVETMARHLSECMRRIEDAVARSSVA